MLRSNRINPGDVRNQLPARDVVFCMRTRIPIGISAEYQCVLVRQTQVNRESCAAGVVMGTGSDRRGAVRRKRPVCVWPVPRGLRTASITVRAPSLDLHQGDRPIFERMSHEVFYWSVLSEEVPEICRFCCGSKIVRALPFLFGLRLFLARAFSLLEGLLVTNFLFGSGVLWREGAPSR